MADKPLAAVAASVANGETARTLSIAKHAASNFIQGLAARPVGFRAARAGGGFDVGDAAGIPQEACDFPQRYATLETCPTTSWGTIR